MLQYGINFFGQIYLTLFFTKSYNKRFTFYAVRDGMGPIVENYQYEYQLEQVVGEFNRNNIILTSCASIWHPMDARSRHMVPI